MTLGQFRFVILAVTDYEMKSWAPGNYNCLSHPFQLAFFELIMHKFFLVYLDYLIGILMLHQY